MSLYHLQSEFHHSVGSEFVKETIVELMRFNGYLSFKNIRLRCSHSFANNSHDDDRRYARFNMVFSCLYPAIKKVTFLKFLVLCESLCFYT